MVNPDQIISLYQPTLHSIALRMLGSIADAEDIVHDTFLKWMTIDQKRIENTKAYLIKTVTNNCINFLNKASEKCQTEILEDVENVLKDDSGEADFKFFDLDSQLSEAWKILHRKLEPAEKAIYVLREVFNVDYEDLQHIVNKNSDNCRKVFSRAKEKIKSEMPRLNLDLSINIALPKSFKNACQFGHLSGLISDLSHDLPGKRKK